METVTCPRCGHAFPLDEGLKTEIVRGLKETVEKELKEREEKIEKIELALKKKESEIPEQAEKLANSRINELRKQIEEQVREGIASESKFKDQRIDELKKSLEESRNSDVKARLELSKLEDDIKQREREMELEIQKRITQERERIRNEQESKLHDEFEIREKEYKEQIESLKRKLEELNKGLSNESNQLVGEAQEIAIEDRLKESFPHDNIISVQRGVLGGDIIHEVVMPNGEGAGKILWESKRTKQWKDDWIDKLKEDRTRSSCDYGIIVTKTMPKNTRGFTMIDGIVVTEFPHIVAVSSLIRVYLINIKRAKLSQADRHTKEGMLYGYITSNDFRNRVQSIVDSISHAKEDLENEKKALNRIWAKRNMELERAVIDLAEVYGRMQGVAGNSLADIPSLQSPSERSENQKQLTDG